MELKIRTIEFSSVVFKFIKLIFNRKKRRFSHNLPTIWQGISSSISWPHRNNLNFGKSWKWVFARKKNNHGSDLIDLKNVFRTFFFSARHDFEFLAEKRLRPTGFELLICDERITILAFSWPLLILLKKPGFIK